MADKESVVRTLALAFLCALGLIDASAQQYPTRRHYLVNQDLLVLAKAGYDERSIIDILLAKPNRFDTSAVALASLSRHGISERVLHAMLVVKAGLRANPEDGSQSTAATLLEASPIQIFPSQPEEQAEQLPMAANGAWYDAPIDTQVDGRCPRGNMSLSLAAGRLPNGLKLTALGFEGTPGEIGRFRFTIRTESNCVTRFRTFELVVSGKPILEATPGEITFDFPVSAQAPASQTILISSTWPSLAYVIERPDASWLHVTQERGVTPGRDSAISGDVVTLTADPSNLKPGTYRASVLLRTYHGANAPAIPVVLVVEAPKPAVATHPAQQ